MMKTYIKILLITLGIQIGYFAIEWILINVMDVKNGFDIGFVLIFPISIIVDIILSIKWGRTLKEKLLCIFLMPTNYTFFVVWAIAMWLVEQFFETLSAYGDSLR